MPIKNDTTEMMALDMVTLLKDLKYLMEVRAGKMMRLDMSMAPIMRMPRTIVIAVSMAIIIL